MCVRHRGWLEGTDWVGTERAEEWEFGEFWEAWVVGRDALEDTFSAQGDWLVDPGWVLEIITQAWLVPCEEGETEVSLCRDLGFRHRNVESAGVLSSVRAGNGEGEARKDRDSALSRRKRGSPHTV